MGLAVGVGVGERFVGDGGGARALDGAKAGQVERDVAFPGSLDN